MKYSIRKGLIRETVCGKELLIATLEARKYCPCLTELNTASALVWDLIEENQDPEQIAGRLVSEYGMAFEKALSVVRSFLAELEKNSYITKGEGL